MTHLDHSFTAPLEKDGSFPTYVTVPGSAELLGTRRAGEDVAFRLEQRFS
jgi:hypothetical protein